MSPIAFGVFGKPAEAAICVVACALALSFLNIDKLKRFKGAGFEAEMRDQFDAMVAADSEPDEEVERTGISVDALGLDPDAKKVVDSLHSSRYTWRSVGGICKETGLNRKTVLSKLGWLEDSGLAIKVGVSTGVNWGLSEKGRGIALLL